MHFKLTDVVVVVKQLCTHINGCKIYVQKRNFNPVTGLIRPNVVALCLPDWWSFTAFLHCKSNFNLRKLCWLNVHILIQTCLSLVFSKEEERVHSNSCLKLVPQLLRKIQLGRRKERKRKTKERKRKRRRRRKGERKGNKKKEEKEKEA